MPRAAQGLDEALRLLRSHLGVSASLWSPYDLEPPSRLVDSDIAEHRFTLSWTASGTAGPVARAIERLQDHVGAIGRIALVVTPFMGAAGAARCAAAGVGWLDLSGNASILGPGLRIHVHGMPNRFIRPGRPANPFAPKSARVTRWLLMHTGTAWRQRALAEATGLSEGAVSKVVRAYEAEGLVVRDPDDGVRVPDPMLLLQAWHERYRFDRHHTRKGSIAARSGVDLVRTVSQAMRSNGVNHAFTGLAATWWWDGFASFRSVVLYVEHWPESPLADMVFVDEPRGANLWVVVPDDAGVLHGATERDGVTVVHPVQAYLDLDAQAERAPEAAEHLRTTVLMPMWSEHA